MVNPYIPHLLLVLEDDKNRQFYNGFAKYHAVKPRHIGKEKIAGGWLKVLEKFKGEHIPLLLKYPTRHLVMVIDFDDEDAAGTTQPTPKLSNRMQLFKDAIPNGLTDRVFIIGCSHKPEKLTAACGKSPETIGELLARDCDEGTDLMWGHAMLRHNAAELIRLREKVRPFLFQS
jgi:hypothetical protein